MNRLNIVMIGCVDFSMHMLKDCANKKLNIVAVVTKTKSILTQLLFIKSICNKKKYLLYIYR